MRASSVRHWSRAHRRLFRLTDGRVGRRLVDNDMLLLTTSGRVTGEAHTVPLLYLRDGDRLVVIASHGGRDHFPNHDFEILEMPLSPNRLFELLYEEEAEK